MLLGILYSTNFPMRHNSKQNDLNKFQVRLGAAESKSGPRAPVDCATSTYPIHSPTITYLCWYPRLGTDLFLIFRCLPRNLFEFHIRIRLPNRTRWRWRFWFDAIRYDSRFVFVYLCCFLFSCFSVFLFSFFSFCFPILFCLFSCCCDFLLLLSSLPSLCVLFSLFT